jgi:hypothetical protein
MLDAGVVDEDVEAAEAIDGAAHHRFDGLGARHVGTVVQHLDAVARSEFSARGFDGGGVAETVLHDVGAGGCEHFGNAQADAAGGAGDEGNMAREGSVDR